MHEVTMKHLRTFTCFLLLLYACNAFAQTGKPIIIPSDSSTQIKNPAFTKDTAIRIVKGDTIKTAM